MTNRHPPFVLFTDTAIERYRYDTFWTKEPETLKWIETFDHSDVFYDVGANVGIYSFYAAYLYPKMKIYAFEPMEVNYKTMHRLRKFNEMGNVLPMRYGISNKRRKGRLDVSDASSGATGAQVGRKGRYKISIESIDSLQRALLPPTHVKIDVDGNEVNILMGMRKTLPKIKSILIEVSRETKEVVFQTLMKQGFSIFNDLNRVLPHSREQRKVENIDAENWIFTRRL